MSHRLGSWFSSVVPLALSLGMTACSSETPSDAPDTASADADVEQDVSEPVLDPLEVRVLSTAPGNPEVTLTEGNAPLTLHLTCDVANEAPEALAFSWKIDDSTSNLRELDWTFTGVADRQVCCSARRASRPDDAAVEDCQFIRVRNTPELSITPPVVAGSSNVGPGTCIDVSLTVTNKGGRVLAPFDVACALSLKDTWDTADSASRIELWRKPIETLKDGKAVPQKVEFVDESMCIPAETAKGGYYLLCKADADDTIEDDRSDNTQYALSLVQVDPVLGKKPDLTVASLALQAGQTFPKSWNQNVGFALDIQNAGEGESGKFEYRVEVCPDTKPAGDPACIAVSAGSQATIFKTTAGQTLSVQRGWTIPSGFPDGRYCFHSAVDVLESVEETDEANNAYPTPACFDVKYTQVDGIDLNLVAVECAPTDAAWNGTLQAKFSVKNLGTLPSGKWKYDVLLSTGAAPTSQTSHSLCADSPGACSEAAALAAGESKDFAPVMKLSNQLLLTTYYCFVKVDSDDTNEELDESNNIKKADEQVAVASKSITDVYVQGATFTPTTQTAGQTITLTYTLGNQEKSTAAGVTVCAVLSADDKITVTDINQKKDIIIGTMVMDTLKPDYKLTPDEIAAQVKTWDVTLPIELDHLISTYKVGVLVDCKGLLTDDKNKVNNGVLASPTTGITVESAKGGCFEDSIEPNVDLAPAQVAAGTVEGLGLCDDGDAYKITVPAGNTLIIDVTASPVLWLTPIAADYKLTLTQGTNVVDTRLSGADGKSYVATYVVPETADYVVQVDPTKAANKAHYTMDVRVQPPLAGIDLVAAQVIASPAVTFSGGALHVDWKLVNGGDTPAGAFTVGVYLSTDEAFDPATDRLAGSLAVASLPKATSLSRKDILVLPTDVAGGSYTVFVRVDDGAAVTEVDESNNLANAGVISIDAANPCVDDTSYEPNNNLESATTLPTVTASYPSLGVCPDLDDWYKVELTAGQNVTATVDYKYVAKAGYLYVQLLDRNGLSALVEGTAASKATVNLPYVWETGTYYVRVYNPKKADLALPYTYSLSIDIGTGAAKDACLADAYEANNDAAHSAQTGCGLRKATLCLKDRDWYTFTLPAKAVVSVTLTNLGGDFKMRLFTDPTLKETATKSGNGALDITAPAAGPQTYWLLIEPKSLTGIDSFNYELFFDGLLGVDLEVTSVTPKTGTAYQGEDEVLGFSIANQCLDPVPSSEVGIFLSTDKELDASDILMRTGPLGGAIPAGGQFNASQKFTVPLETPPGNYSVFVVADPDDVITESNESNNAMSAPFFVTALCVDDAAEPNNGAALAHTIADGVTESLQICPYDVDWYKIALNAGETLFVTLDFVLASGDLDMRLYAAGNTTTPLLKAFETKDGESLSWKAATSGTYTLRVNGLSGATNAYKMTVAVEGPPVCGDGKCYSTEDCVTCATDCGPVFCNDGNTCTDDVCAPAANAAGYECFNPFTADGLACDDGQSCTSPDSCVAGVCVGANDTCACTVPAITGQVFTITTLATFNGTNPAYSAFDLDGDVGTCSPATCTDGLDNALEPYGVILDPVLADGIAEGSVGLAFEQVSSTSLALLRVGITPGGPVVLPDSFDATCGYAAEFTAVSAVDGSIMAGGPSESFVLMANVGSTTASFVVRHARVRAVPVVDQNVVIGWRGAIGGTITAESLAIALNTSEASLGTVEQILSVLLPDYDEDGDGVAESLTIGLAFDAVPETVAAP